MPEPSAVAVPSTVVPFVSYSVTVAPASAPEPVMTGVVTLVRLSVLLAPESEALARSGVPDADGAAVSIVTDRPVEAGPVFPAASVSLVVRVCVPLLSVLEVMLQLPELSAVAVPNTVVPFVSYRVTVAPTSAPEPVITGVVTLVMLSVLLLPESEALARSGAPEADGAVVSIVTDRPVEAGPVLPAASVTLVVRL